MSSKPSSSESSGTARTNFLHSATAIGPPRLIESISALDRRLELVSWHRLDGRGRIRLPGLGIEAIAGDEEPHAVMGPELAQADHRDDGRDDTDANLAEAEHRLLGGDHDVRSSDEAEAAGKGRDR